LHSAIFASLNEYEGHDLGETQYYEEGSYIFHEGDVGDAAYLVIHGSVEVIARELDEVGLILGPGQSFGERALLTRDLRSASIRTTQATTLRRLSYESFQALYQSSPQFKALLEGMDLMSRLPNRGNSVSFPSEVDQVPCLNRQYTLDDGQQLLLTWAPILQSFTIQYVPSIEHEYSYEWGIDPESEHPKRSIKTDGENRVVRLRSSGPWPDLPWLIEATLEQRPLDVNQLTEFVEAGRIVRDPDLLEIEQKIICRCIQLTTEELMAQVERGCATRRELQRATGCGMICGGCLPTIDLLLGVNEWIPITARRRRHNSDVFEFELIPDGLIDLTWRAGQHVVISGRVDQLWVERSYTITASESADLLSIAVKREPHGLFSRWLCDGLIALKELRMSQPRGDLVWSGDNELCCFVSGIGVTPVMAMVRTAIDRSRQGQSVAPIDIHYSCRPIAQAHFIDELREACSLYPAIRLTLYVSGEGTRLQKEDIEQAIAKRESSVGEGMSYLLCGSVSYMDFVEDSLLGLGVPAERIHSEKFILERQSRASSEPAQRSRFIRRVYQLTLVASILLIWLQSTSLGLPLKTTGMANTGHEGLSCESCHLPAPGSTRQQLQAKV